MQFTGIKKQAARHPAKHGRRSGRIRRPFRRKFWNINGTETTIIANDYLYGFHSHRDCHDSTLPVAPAPFAGSFPPIRKTPAEGVRARQPARARRAMPATARDGLHGRQPGRRDRLAARLGRSCPVRLYEYRTGPDIRTGQPKKREGLSAESVARKAGPLDRHRLLGSARQPRVPLHRQTAAMDPQPVGRPVSRAGRRLRGHVRAGTLRSLCVQGRRDGLRGRSEPGCLSTDTARTSSSNST